LGLRQLHPSQIQRLSEPTWGVRPRHPCRPHPFSVAPPRIQMRPIGDYRPHLADAERRAAASAKYQAGGISRLTNSSNMLNRQTIASNFAGSAASRWHVRSSSIPGFVSVLIIDANYAVTRCFLARQILGMLGFPRLRNDRSLIISCKISKNSGGPPKGVGEIFRPTSRPASQC
jgi:hypothetical protein